MSSSRCIIRPVRLFLILVNRHIRHKAVHQNKMADASAHHKQVKYFMGAKGLVKLVKYRKLQCVNDTPDGVNDTAGQKPSEGGFGESV